MWLVLKTLGLDTCLISLFSPSNVDIIDSYFYMSILNVYYITLCRLHEKHSILSEVKNWQVCYLGVVTLAMAHYIANLPKILSKDCIFHMVVFYLFILDFSCNFKN
jgi:hypothetical protein